MSKTQELEVGTSFSFNDGQEQDTVLNHVGAALGSFVGEIALQTRLAISDARNGSSLRQTRNELLRVKRIEDMAAKAGLIAVNK